MRGIPLLYKHECQLQPLKCHNTYRQKENKKTFVRMHSEVRDVFGWCVEQG